MLDYIGDICDKNVTAYVFNNNTLQATIIYLFFIDLSAVNYGPQLFEERVGWIGTLVCMCGKGFCH